MSDNNSFKMIPIDEARDLMEDKDLLLLDIRDQESFRHSHFKNAINLNNENLNEIVEKTDHKKNILVYCYKGISSQNVAQHFCNLGFKNVFSLNGGFKEDINSE